MLPKLGELEAQCWGTQTRDVRPNRTKGIMNGASEGKFGPLLRTFLVKPARPDFRLPIRIKKNLLGQLLLNFVA